MGNTPSVDGDKPKRGARRRPKEPDRLMSWQAAQGASPKPYPTNVKRRFNYPPSQSKAPSIADVVSLGLDRQKKKVISSRESTSSRRSPDSSTPTASTRETARKKKVSSNDEGLSAGKGLSTPKSYPTRLMASGRSFVNIQGADAGGFQQWVTARPEEEKVDTQAPGDMMARVNQGIYTIGGTGVPIQMVGSGADPRQLGNGLLPVTQRTSDTLFLCALTEGQLRQAQALGEAQAVTQSQALPGVGHRPEARGVERFDQPIEVGEDVRVTKEKKIGNLGQLQGHDPLHGLQPNVGVLDGDLGDEDASDFASRGLWLHTIPQPRDTTRSGLSTPGHPHPCLAEYDDLEGIVGPQESFQVRALQWVAPLPDDEAGEGRMLMQVKTRRGYKECALDLLKPDSRKAWQENLAAWGQRGAPGSKTKGLVMGQLGAIHLGEECLGIGVISETTGTATTRHWTPEPLVEEPDLRGLVPLEVLEEQLEHMVREREREQVLLSREKRQHLRRTKSDVERAPAFTIKETRNREPGRMGPRKGGGIEKLLAASNFQGDEDRKCSHHRGMNTVNRSIYHWD